MRNISVILSALILASCSDLQVKRDLEHAELSKNYRASLSSAEDFNPNKHCAMQGAIDTWSPFEFTSSTPIIKLPSGMQAEAVCMSIPAGSRALELYSYSNGGMTYYELTIVHPSLQFLDERFELIKDAPKIRLSPGESFFTGIGLSGITVLTTDLSEAKYVIAYVHPLSLDGAINVQTGLEVIPVLYNPYGSVKIRFQ